MSSRTVAITTFGGVPIKRGRNARHDADVSLEAARRVGDLLGKHLDHARSVESAADDQHQGDYRDGRVAKPGEEFVLRHDTQQECHNQRRECDQVVAKSTPEQKPEYGEDEKEKDSLIGCNFHASARGSGCDSVAPEYKSE